MSHTRSTTIAIAGALLGTIGIASGQDAPPDSKAANHVGPRLELSQAEWNFGQLWFGDPCETEIELRNTGDATLRISEVKSTCGCTVAQPKKKELAPGETVSMTVKYKTTKNVRKVVQYITIITNDPARPQVRFPVRGEVWHVFDANPNLAAFGQIKPDSRKEIAIELRNNLEEPVFPELAPLRPGYPFETELVEVEPGRRYKLIVRTKPPIKPGPVSTSAILQTHIKRLPQMTFRISAVSIERVAMSPTRVWVTAAQTKTAKRTLHLLHPQGQPLEITGLASSLPSIGVRVLTDKRPPTKTSEFAAYMIELTLPPYAEIPDEGASIEVTTNDADPQFQKLVVPIKKSKPAPSAVRKVSSNPPRQVVPEPNAKAAGEAGKDKPGGKSD